jgi:hypothetical protein
MVKITKLNSEFIASVKNRLESEIRAAEVLFLSPSQARAQAFTLSDIQKLLSILETSDVNAG